MHQPCRPAPPGRLSPDGPGPSLMNPALAARVRQLAAQAEHRRAIAGNQARHAADQQARVNALLLETIDTLGRTARRPVSLTPRRSPDTSGNPASITKTCRPVNTERCRLMSKQRGR